ncbi:MAG TPA: flagellar biosynthesis protein FlhB [Myxococcales bacterium]|nr:flagellar biosynthesis protein FlhB [Myxococcales bacterium]
MAEQSGEKTEEATPKKLEDARKKGQVWKSRDMTGAFVFLAGFFCMAALFPFILEKAKEGFALTFSKIGLEVITFEDIAQAAYGGLFAVIVLTVPVAMAGAIAGGLSDFLQVGSLFTLDPVKPKLDKLNPIQGLKNLVSKKQLVELVKSTAKLLLACYVAYRVLKGELGLVVGAARGTPEQVMTAAGSLAYTLVTRMAMLLVLLALFDLWWQRHSFLKDQRMTKDEVKREYKESEGDPHHKAKRKELHQEILESASIEDVAGADVVITNPDHYAVALRYEREQDSAPRVVAKGVDAKAQRIKQIAAQAGVATMRNVPLAHALYRLELGDEIPEELYDAVAEVLNFVYAQQQREEMLG